MSLRSTIQDDMKNFMKNKDTASLTVVRMLWSALRNLEIDSRTDLTDGEIHSLVQKMIKQREESLSFLRQDASRSEQVAKESFEIDFLKRYLPPQMSEEEVRAIVLEVKESMQASTAKDLGKMMGVLMPKLKGQCDPSLISRLAKEALNA